MKRFEIAIVEDNPDNRELLAVLLEDDYDLSEYEDGASALAGIGEKCPDLVLMDISLPGMDGMETLNKLRQTHPQVVAIALTAHAMRGDRERFIAAGFNGYLSKPIVDEVEFFSTIQSLLT